MKNVLPILAMLMLTALAAALFQACTSRESGRPTGQAVGDAAGQDARAAGQAERGTTQGERPETLMLVPMMQLLLEDVKTLDEGIYLEDYAMMAEGAGGIADHPVMTGGEKELVKSALGEEMARFVEFDMTVHHRADSIRAAAQQEQLDEVLRHYRIMQQGCVDCHTSFRAPIQQARQDGG